MAIRFFDMFAGIGGFRSGLEAIGGFECVGYCEIDKYCRFHAWNYRFFKFWILFEYDTEFARITERRSRYDARRNGAKGFAKIPFDCKRTGHR